MKLPFKSEHECEWKQRAEQLETEVVMLRERSAFEDPVTGLGNSQQFSRDALRMAAQYRRQSTLFSIAILEVRQVEEPSRRLSPQTLTEIARALLDATRLEDSVSQLSEHRFGVVLANSDRAGALQFVERICRRVSSAPLVIAARPTFVQIAGGVAQWEPQFETVAEIGAAALSDLAQYQAALQSERSTFAPAS